MVLYSVTKNRAIFNQLSEFPFRMFLVPSGGRFLPLHQSVSNLFIAAVKGVLLPCALSSVGWLRKTGSWYVPTENNLVFLFSAASDRSGWDCTNNHVGDSNSCTNWNSSENSARDNGHLHCCHSKILRNVTSIFVHSHIHGVHIYIYL